MLQCFSHAALFELSPNPYMVLDRNLVFLEANEAYLQVTGRRRDEIIGCGLFEAFPGNPADPQDSSVAQLRASLEQVLQSKRAHHLALIRYAIPLQEQGGTVFEERFWSATHVPLLDADGAVAAILQHTVDVTEMQRLKQVARVNEIEGGMFRRAQAVQARHDSLDLQQRHLQRLFEQAPGFMAVLRGPLHIVELVNVAYRQIIGQRDVVGKPLGEALPEIAEQGFLDTLDRVYARGEPYIGRDARIELQREPGKARQEHFLDFIYQPVFEDDGSVSGILVQGHDITQQHCAHEEMLRYRAQLEALLGERTADLMQSRAEHVHTQTRLEHVQRLEGLGRLTGGVAHDFNNLLQIMNNSLLLLQRATPGNQQAERWIGIARNAVANGSRLTGQLLAFARRQPLEPEVLNVGNMLRGMDDLLRRAVGEGVQIGITAGADLWNVCVDPTQLENVILNLAINARDAMQGQGSLTLEIDNVLLDEGGARAHVGLPAGEYVRVTVGDAGPGMAPEVLERVFEPFFSTKPVGQGTGLGLSMVYGFVRQSGGLVTIDSEPGSGTRVVIHLPRVDRHEAQPELQMAGPVVGGSETILVVEDEPTLLLTTTEALTDLGYRVLKAKDAQAAMAIVSSGAPIDLLFTDVVMPGPMRSTELARQAKAVLPGLEVLFTSGYAQDAIVHDGRLDTGVQLLPKPYGYEQLARRIRQCLAAGRPRTAAAVPPSIELSVLFVEDDPEQRVQGYELLCALGHRATTAASAEQALPLLQSERFDVLLSDVALPGRSGTSLAREARRQAPHLAVILVSGFGRAALPAEDEIGASALLLPKPYSLEGLKKALDTVARATSQA